MFRSFRTRITLTLIVLVGVTAVLVGVLAFTLVRRALDDQLVETALAQTDFNVGVLASTDVLAPDADATDLTASGLTERFLQRGPDGVFVEFPGSDETFASDFGLLDADSALSTQLRALVAQGRFGYEFVDFDDTEWLVVGARRPEAGPDFYFFYNRQSDLDALAQLRTVLIGSVVAVIAVGALIAGLVARSVLQPVRIAGAAARRMADGDLSVRLAAESRDELGALAVSFNEMAAALDRQMTALDEARRREQRFVADVSHELRTPLTGLVGAAGLLRDRELDEQSQRLAEIVSTDIGRLRRLVEDLLEISGLEARDVPPDLRSVDVDRFLEAVVGNRRSPASVTANVGSVVTASTSLERIVGNLLDNAAHHADGAPVSVEAIRRDDEIIITVADEGPGVPEEAVAHLFDRFFTADPARSGGTGLGLAIAREHARRLGGDLTVSSNEPIGLRFTLRIPVTDSLHAGEGVATAIPEADGEHIEGGSL